MATKILREPDLKSILEEEYYVLNKIYNLDTKREEKMMCVVATGRNLFENDKYNFFFKSINSQNYTNFQVFHVDDDSDDGTTLKMYAYVAQ